MAKCKNQPHRLKQLWVKGVCVNVPDTSESASGVSLRVHKVMQISPNQHILDARAGPHTQHTASSSRQLSAVLSLIKKQHANKHMAVKNCPSLFICPYSFGSTTCTFQGWPWVSASQHGCIWPHVLGGSCPAGFSWITVAVRQRAVLLPTSVLALDANCRIESDVCSKQLQMHLQTYKL